PWVLGEQKQWQPFFEHMENAPAIEPVARLVRLLEAQDQAILICSGRPERYRRETLGWLDKNRIPYDQAYLRPDGQDRVADETVKEQLLRHACGWFCALAGAGRSRCRGPPMAQPGPDLPAVRHW
ncbi:MAG: hypothetical protein WD601_01570, partial [Pseudohongiellaceae bacterium]